MRKGYVIDKIALALLIIGGINWGLIGLFDYNLVAKVFGNQTTLSRAIYVLVGLSALFTAIYHFTPHEEVYREKPIA